MTAPGSPAADHRPAPEVAGQPDPAGAPRPVPAAAPNPAPEVAGHPLPEGLLSAGDPALRAWLDRLPGRVADVLERWELTALPPFLPGGSSAWVAPVRTADGAERVLKVAWAHDEARDEAAGMRAWQGHGVAELYRSERRGETSALLLEHVRPGVPLAASLSWQERDEVTAAALRRLRMPVVDLLGTGVGGESAPFRPLADMCEWWADGAERRAESSGPEHGIPSAGDAGPPLPRDLVEHGLGLFRELPRNWDGEQILLVTDLNPGNLLSHDGPEGWLLIDPKPYVGDPHYDVLQHMLNDAARLVADPSAFADRMAGLAGLDRRRTRQWLLARCVQESGEFGSAASAALRLAADGVE